MIEVIEGQLAREQKIADLVGKFCPNLYLHSRARRGMVRSRLRRLRFDRKRPLGWLWRIFGAATDKVALTITAVGQRSLGLADGWSEIEIHVYDPDFSKKAGQIALEYGWATAQLAGVIFRPLARQSSSWPALRFAAFALAMTIVVLGLRFLSLTLIRNFLGF